MFEHDISALPLADDVKITEDCEEIQKGEGYWQDASGSVAYRLDIIDVSRGGAFAFLVISSGNSSVLFGLRLKIEDSEITQIETMVVKNSNEGMIFSPNGFIEKDDAPMTMMPDPSELNTREEMIEMAVKYPEGLKAGGTFQKNGVPFTAVAFRLENGQLMAGPGCTFMSGCEDIRTQGLPPALTDMVYQVALVDEEAGIVLIRMNFGKGSVMGDNNSTLDVFEAFKAYGDSMHAVSAFMQKKPDVSDRTPEELFGWDYDQNVTAIRSVLSAVHATSAVYPLIARNSITIHNPAGFDKCVIRLFDVSGRMVFNRSLTEINGNVVVDMVFPTLPCGHYIGRVEQYTGGTAVSAGSFFFNRIE
jgi:hypothetical protein